MESILLLLDCVAIVLAAYWYVRNETRKPGEKIGGLLRFREAEAPARKPAKPARPGRARPDHAGWER